MKQVSDALFGSGLMPIKGKGHVVLSIKLR